MPCKICQCHHPICLHLDTIVWMPQQQQQQQQQPSNQQAIYANEMLMGGGGSTNVMQTSLTNNNELAVQPMWSRAITTWWATIPYS
ncbi:hypothetical protein CVS40_11508 [Lucilia cuprina]|nr:hypothetical protein CVS40_11508 [Lucilia cuprina]